MVHKMIIPLITAAFLSACTFQTPAAESATGTPELPVIPSPFPTATIQPTSAPSEDVVPPETTAEFESRAMLDKEDPQYVNCLGYPVTKRYLTQYTDVARQRGLINEDNPEIIAGELPFPKEPTDCYYLRYVNPSGEIYIIYRQEPMEDYVFLKVSQ